MTRRQSCRLIIVPITLKDARAFVAQHHRHHEPGTHGLFAVAVAREGAEDVAGVAIVSRPSARMLCDGWTAEVTRCATDGTPNGCSALYGAAWRAARALGYRRLVTYTLKSEGGGRWWRADGAASGNAAADHGLGRRARGSIAIRCRQRSDGSVR